MPPGVDDPYSFIKRALLIVAIAVGAGLIVRPFFVPASFGKYGDFRGDHLFELREQIPVHGDGAICASCHEENAVKKVNGRHAAVPCETCHFQPYSLEENRPDGHPEKSTPPDRSREACAICHQFLPPRPPAFPQLKDIAEHIDTYWGMVSEQLPKETAEGSVCITCHDPHSPLTLRNT